MCSAPVGLHAELQAPPPESIESLENTIATKMKSLASSAGTERVVEVVETALRNLGIDIRTVLCVPKNSIWCCFICTSVEQLETLRYHYESEFLKDELERIFNILTNKKILIQQLKWDADEYNERRQRLEQLIAFGW